MIRPWDETRYYDDPVVRQTISRLRASIFAAVVFCVLGIVLAGLVGRLAFDDGAASTAAGQAAKATTATATPAATATKAGKKLTAAQQRRAAATQAERARQQADAAKVDAPTAFDGIGWRTWLALLGGFPLLGFSLYVIVRRPYSAARSHASSLVHAYRALEESTLETFAALNASVEAKDRYTAGHGLRVTLMSVLIGQEMGLNEQELDSLRHAATFHDIGKIAVPDGVLQKEGRLSDEECRLMEVHAVESARICGKVAVLRDSVPAVRHHHERMDGRGYPDRLVGYAIPLGARIIAVADAWDAITSDRPYRQGQQAAIALDEVRRCSGSQFDPAVVDAFNNVLDRDPWMFGLTPMEVKSFPAAPGRQVETRSRTSEPDAPEEVAAGTMGVDAMGDDVLSDALSKLDLELVIEDDGYEDFDDGESGTTRLVA